MAKTIHPVILCGGSGTRLWPVSRRSKPKPFLPLLGEQTLFEEALARVSDSTLFGAPTVVAGSAHVDAINVQAGGAQARIVVEPCARNTAPAIALAAARLDPDDVMLVCPSDHHIADEAAFRQAAAAAAALAGEGWLVSFGIAPTRAETGYGYLERGEPLSGGHRIARFVEKPDAARAEAYLASGDFSWNGGIFAFRTGQFLDELAAYRPEMAEAVRVAVAEGHEDGALFHPAEAPFAAIAGESVDYAVMENTARAAMVRAEMGWSDIGSWASLHEALEASGGDAQGNAVRGTADLAQCERVLAFSDGPRISAIGVSDLCIVVSDGEVLVTTHEGAQMVGKLPGAANQ